MDPNKEGMVASCAFYNIFEKNIPPSAPTSYRRWARFERSKLQEELGEIQQHIGVMLYKPNFNIFVDVRNGIEGLKYTLQSIDKQFYPHYDLRILGEHGVESTNITGITRQLPATTHFGNFSGDFVVWLESGQMLAMNTLYEFANALNIFPDVDIIYGDEDISDESGRREKPFYKPDWSPDYIETFNYIGFPTCFRASIASNDIGASQYDLILRLTEHTSKVMHIQKILGHKLDLPRCDDKWKSTASANIRALQGRLTRTGRSGTVREHPQHKGCYDIRLVLKATPLVSIIIPTAGKFVTVGNREVDLIANVVDHIIHRSSYKNIEIIVVDNGDLTDVQLDLLARNGIKRISYRGCEVNISKKLNLGSTLASGDLFVLMNDDIEIATSSWVERLVEHFEKSHVGVVGARLLYPDGRIQHAGVTHNFGIPDHVRRFSCGDEAGYFFSTCGVRNYSAVTGAVMMVMASVYQKVGGYTEELAVSYNDIDFCMKVQEEGLSVVYAPEAKLIHMESVSRASRLDWIEERWYRERWSAKIAPDRYYNERFLSLTPATFDPVFNRKRF